MHAGTDTQVTETGAKALPCVGQAIGMFLTFLSDQQPGKYQAS